MTAFYQLILAIIIHELGHFITALLLGVRLRSFSLKPNGGLLTYDFSAVSYQKELAVHLAGSIFGLISVVVSVMLCHSYSDSFNKFIGISLSLSAVNLIPIKTLDGHGVLRTALYMIFSTENEEKIENITNIASNASLILLWIITVAVELNTEANLSLLIFVLPLLIRGMLGDQAYR